MSGNFSGEAVFFEDVPVLTVEHVRARHAAYEAGQRVTSGLVAVGHVMPSSDELALLNDLRPNQFDIGLPRQLFEQVDRFRDAPALGLLYRKFISIVQCDIDRGGLKGSEHILIWALDAQEESTSWHIDTGHMQIRYTMGLGRNASTRGAIGAYTKDDFDFVGDVKPGVPVTLQEPFDPGTVVRITLGDVHETPESLHRIWMRDTFKIHSYS